MSANFLGRRLVGYRTDSGRAVILDARCAHLAADLGRGNVVGENIQCPFHHWQFGPDGRCHEIPAQDEIPPFARQRSYPVTERNGLVFFFDGAQPLFPLPFFFDCDPEDFRSGKPFDFVSNCSWQMLVANGFDGQHFQAVHDRRLTRPPVVDCPAPFARRIQFNAEVIGDSIFDRLLRRFVGKFVDVSITCWGGSLTLVTGHFGRAHSYILIATRPLAEFETLTEVVVFTRRIRNRWFGALFEPLSLHVRRLFTQGFLQNDIKRLDGIRHNPHTVLESDALMVDFVAWLDALQRTAAAPMKGDTLLQRDVGEGESQYGSVDSVQPIRS